MATFTGVTPVIGGTEIFGGSAFTTTAAVVGAAVGMTVTVTPRTFPGNGIYWEGYVSAPGVVTVKVGAAITLFVEASIYDVLVDDGTTSGLVTSVTGTAPITSSGGSTPNIAINKATVASLGAVQPDGSSIVIDGAGVISAVTGGAGTVTGVLAAAPITSDLNPVTPTIGITDATNLAKGAVQVDGTTITAAAGVISAAAGASPAVTAVTGAAPIVSSGGLTPAISVNDGSAAAKGVVQVDGITITAAAGVITAVVGPSLTAPIQANWTAFNTAGMNLVPTFQNSRWEMVSSAQAGDIIQGVAVALPSAPYTRTFRITPYIGQKAFTFAGIGFADGSVGTPGKFVLFGLQMSGSAGVFGPIGYSAANNTNSTTFNSVVTLTKPLLNPPAQNVASGRPLWFQVIDNNTNWTVRVSADSTNGTNGTWVEVFTEPRNTFLTATQLVVFVTGNGTSTTGMIFDSYA